MKTNTIQQEILLMTKTTFSSRQWCEKDDTGNSNHLSENEKLEEACWNGLLKELIPEIFGQPFNSKTLSLWEIRKGKSFLDLELGEFPSTKDLHFSIDPYSFLPTKLYN